MVNYQGRLTHLHFDLCSLLSFLMQVRIMNKIWVNFLKQVANQETQCYIDIAPMRDPY
jgi:hypothetical protein